MHGDFGIARAIARAGHQAPGFAIAFESGATLRIRIEPQKRIRADGLDRDYVPEVPGHNVGYEEINGVFGVASVVGPGAYSVATVSVFLMGGLDLHAPTVGTSVHDEVKATAIAPGFGDVEAQRGGFGEERGFTHVASSTRGGALARFLGGVRCSRCGFFFHSESQKGAGGSRA